MTDLRLQEQHNESELHTLLDRFFTAVDAGRWPIAEACLAASVVEDLRIYGDAPAPRQVPAPEFIAQLQARLAQLPVAEHRATSPRFTVDGDSALGQTHVRIRWDTGHARLTRYADLSCRFVREAGRWSIQRLEFTVVRDDGDPTILS